MKPAAWIGSAEAEKLLSVRRCFLLKLIQDGEIQSARLVDQPGKCRHYTMKRADVLALKERGFRTYNQPRQRSQFILWERYFGEVPRGYSPVFRDNDRNNVAPGNLVLQPLAHMWRNAARGERKRRKVRNVWTPERAALFVEKFARTTNDDLVRELGISKASIVRRARQLRMRKDSAHIAAVKQRGGRYMEIGTERLHQSTNTIYVKVSDTGTPRQQWRPKAHVVWEKHHGRPVPTRNVIFKDGNNQNFDPANLVALSKNETSALVNARMRIMPAPLRKVITITNQIKEEAAKQMLGASNPRAKQTKSRTARKSFRGVSRPRWTPEMDAVLRRDLPVKIRPEIAAGLGVTEQAIRNRARRLGLVRPPQIMLAEARAKAAAQAEARV